MAQPFLVAMEHAEWHAGSVLRKHSRNRSLAHIEMEHGYVSPQPVLSCKSVDIDTHGTRTYRAKCSSDIIEEQHKLIHEVYTKARNISSAPAYSSRLLRYQSDSGLRALTALRIQGNRPSTSPGSRSQSDRRGTGSALKKRPHTATKSKAAQSSVSSFLQIQVDPDLWQSTRASQDISRQIRTHWDPDSYSLDEGIYARGNKDQSLQSCSDPKTGGQWLTFGGGQRARSAGVVDAFTAMKDQEEIYSIEGSTASQVARQVQKGEKIRIGVNGKVQSLDFQLRPWILEQQSKLQVMEEKRSGRPSEPLPLCWSDIVDRDDSRVMQSKAPVPKTPPPNLCESHAVLFKTVSATDKDDSMRSRKDFKVNGYHVKSRTKSRVGLDGHESPASRITSITIDKRNEEYEKQLEKVTYDDILQLKVQSKSKETRERGTKGKASVTNIENKGTVENTRRKYMDEKQSEKEQQEDVGGAGDQVHPSRSAILSRPQTAASVFSQDAELDALVVGSAPVRPQTRAVDTRGQARMTSAGRPSLPRPPLHKSPSAPSPASSAQPLGRGDAAFIQFSSQIPLSRERLPSGGKHGPDPEEHLPPPPSPGASTHSAISSITEHNKTAYGSDRPDRGPAADDGDRPSAEAQPPPHNTPTPAAVSPQPASSPHPSDVKVAFNIPTGQDHDTSEVNSVADPVDLERRDIT